MENLKKEIKKTRELLKDFGKFKHLFSKDDAEKTLAKLHRSLGRILFKIKLSTIKEVVFPENRPLRERFGKEYLVRIRPCGDGFKDKTYIGFYIGDIALNSSIEIQDDKVYMNFERYNPAIFVPELGKIIFGMESWWSIIKDESELKDITNDNIGNVWYIKALKQFKTE